MKRGEAEALVGFMRGAWDTYLDAHGEEAWLRFFIDLDADTSTEAFTRLRDTSPERPTMYDFRQVYMQLDRAKGEGAKHVEAHVEQAKVEAPLWAQAKRLARADGDTRVFSDQKEGYDQLQQANPGSRTYVWAEQDVMPADVESEYRARAASMSVTEINDYVRTQGAAREAAGEPVLPDLPVADLADVDHYPA